MVYRERYLKAVEHRRSGLFGLSHNWEYALIDDQAREIHLNTIELLRALVPDKDRSRTDAYMCLDRAKELFLQGRSEWVGYPSGAVIDELENS